MNGTSQFQANIPLPNGEGLVSPGLAKFGTTLTDVLRGYLQDLGASVQLPGQIYKGEAQPTLGTSLDFASRFAGGGFLGAGRGGLGMGGRRFIKPVAQPVAKATARETIPDEQELLTRLIGEARTQQNIGRRKAAQTKVADLTTQFQKQVIKHERIPKSSTKLIQTSDDSMTDLAVDISRYRKMLRSLEEEWF